MNTTHPVSNSPEKPPRMMTRGISTKDKIKTVTILLLGETGVGKSTFINAFINYLAYDTLDEAKRAEKIHCLIPTSFTVTDAETYQRKTINFGGKDENEVYNKGQSVTQSCKCYTFPLGNTLIKLIDTPGIGDTRGVESDGINMLNLLDFIASYDELNAICFLLLPNNSKVGVLFKYCILQLLTHLNKSASENIVFLFTNARSTAYMPGESGPSLQYILDMVKERPPHVEIKFSHDNWFCFDNEAFRYLAASTGENKVNYSQEMIGDFNRSWNRSVAECKRLMEYIKTLPPHKVRDTVSVNNARNTIQLLIKPLADNAKNISENELQCKLHEKKVADWNGDVEELKRNLFIPVKDIKSVALDHPITVCSDDKCCEKIYIQNTVKIHYKTICHSPCYLKYSDGNIMGNTGLLDCETFNRYEKIGSGNWVELNHLRPDQDPENMKWNKEGKIWAEFVTRVKLDNCVKCGHSFQTHLHIDYETQYEDKELRDEKRDKEILTREDARKAQEEQIAMLKLHVEKLHAESNKITNSMALFACFLKDNALTPFNDAYEEYIKYLVEEERRSNANDQRNRLQRIDNLNRMVEAYRTEKKVIDDAIRRGSARSEQDLSSENVDQMIKNLCQLEISGENIRNCLKMRKDLQRHSQANKNEMQIHIKNDVSTLITRFSKMFD